MVARNPESADVIGIAVRFESRLALFNLNRTVKPKTAQLCGFYVAFILKIRHLTSHSAGSDRGHGCT